MRHGKHTFKIGRTASHRRCLVANMLKSLVENERIVTSVAKAKELRRHADRLITLAKKNTLASKRRAAAELMVNYNPLTSKEARVLKNANDKAKAAATVHNMDRKVVSKLFGELSSRFVNRAGGYTRIVRIENRVGDNQPTCVLEYLSD